MIGHIALALLILGLVGLTLRSVRAGAAAAIAWSVAREVAQAEYRWIEHLGGGRRANMPWWGGLDPSVWRSIDPWIDWIVPSLAVLAVTIGVVALGRRTS